MDTAIANQTRNQKPADVTELVLDTCKATKVSGLDKFTNLKTLTLNACGMTTLEGFPQLSYLQRLELSDNNLQDGLDVLEGACLINLKSLSLAGNKFSTLESLEPLVCTARPPLPGQSAKRWGVPQAGCRGCGQRREAPSAARAVWEARR